MPETRDAPRPRFRVGLTGGIASGKTTVSSLFADLGAAIIDTDVIAREVVEPGRPALAAIRNEFGEAVMAEDGTLDRAAMRRVIFTDADARRRLEAILHPVIRDETIRQAAAADGPYQLIVVPLLAGSPLAALMDRILVVDCDEATQIRRLMDRDAESEGQARRMLAAQVSREDRLAIADDVVDNGGDLDETRARVEALHRKYVDLAAR